MEWGGFRFSRSEVFVFVCNVFFASFLCFLKGLILVLCKRLKRGPRDCIFHCTWGLVPSPGVCGLGPGSQARGLSASGRVWGLGPRAGRRVYQNKKTK